MAEPESRQVEDLLRQALAREVGDRSDFLWESCRGDVLMRTRIERLLALSGETAVAPELPAATGPLFDDGPPKPDRIGRYHVRRVIATGGMGIVYEAVQEKPHRAVALKVMRRGIASRSTLRRFEFESQILARLRHPNIAHVYEASTHDDGSGGVPFFAMEYIPGAKTIIDHAQERKLDTRACLELFMKVCHAVQHGHQKGIIHRDLKPGNILVDSEGQPKIIDFGVARATDSDMAVTTLQTDVGQLIGTLQYMSPEQCEADPHDLDSRSDVYALGVVLYELLCGDLPYDVTGASVVEAARVIREETPTRLSAINGTLRGDLETIVFMTLDKDRTRRYQSAAELAADIGRYLSHEPIMARPPSAVYQLRKFARRNKLLVGGVATLIVVLAAATVVSAGFAFGEAEQRRAAATERDVARAVNDFLNDDLLAAVVPSSEPGKGVDVLMRDVLDAAAERIEEAAAPGGRFEGKPLVEASIRHTLGVTYLRLTEHGAAEAQLARACEIRRKELGDEHSETLATMSELASLYDEQSRYGEAEELYVKLLELRTRVLGNEHPDTLESKHTLGWHYTYHAPFGHRPFADMAAEAEALLREALDGRRHVLGDEHPDTLSSLHRLGWNLTAQHRFQEAEPLCEEALEIYRRVLGDDHRNTNESMSSLANLYLRWGRYAEAEKLYLEVLEGRTRLFGAYAYWTVGIKLNLARMYVKQGRFDEAEPLFRQGLEKKEEIFAEDHPLRLNNMRELANLYLLQGRVEVASPLMRRYVRVVQREHIDAGQKNAAAWWLLTCEPVDLRDPQTALALALQANEMTGCREPNNLDSLSLAYHLTGDTAGAIENQNKAIDLLPPGESPLRTEMEGRLADFVAAASDDAITE